MRIAIENGINNDFICRIKIDIDNLLSKCPIYQNEKNHIYIVEKVDFEIFEVQLNNIYKTELEKGFGLAFSNYDFKERGIKCHIVILNKENCERLLDNNEQIAVTLHEIGHILNYFRGSTTDEYKTYQKEQFIRAFGGLIDRIMTFEEAKLENEFYADSFAKKYGYSEQLKSSLLKYIEDGNEDKKAEFQNRIYKLDLSHELIGSIKQLK